MNPSHFAPVLRWLLAAVAVSSGLASCTVYEEGYYGGGPRYGGGPVYGGGPYYGGGPVNGGGYGYGYDDWNDEYYSYHPAAYSGYVSYSTRCPYYYGGRYYSYRWWDDDRYSNYRHDHGSNHSQYRHRRSDEELKLVRYRQEDRGQLPTGYHSKEWYKDRGISLKENTYRDREGELHGRQPRSSGSSGSSSSGKKHRDSDSSRGSSSSSRNRDDDRQPSSHPRALLQPEKYRYTGERETSRRSSSSSSSSSNRSREDNRPTSEHPRALRQPEKYRYTGSAGGGDRSSHKNKKD